MTIQDEYNIRRWGFLVLEKFQVEQIAKALNLVRGESLDEGQTELLELARQHVNVLREVVSERTLDYQSRKKCVGRCPPKTTLTTEKSQER
jgi:hypothetical protein